MTFKELKLDDGRVLQVNVLAKTWSCLIVRTVDNKYFLLSKYHILNAEEFGFKSDFKGYEDKPVEFEGQMYLKYKGKFYVVVDGKITDEEVDPYLEEALAEEYDKVNKPKTKDDAQQ